MYEVFYMVQDTHVCVMNDGVQDDASEVARANERRYVAHTHKIIGDTFGIVARFVLSSHIFLWKFGYKLHNWKMYGHN